MSKHNVILSCACGYNNCGREMTVSENEDNPSLVVLSVKTPRDFIPEFFELNHDTAKELVKYLTAKYKLRGE